MRATPLTPDDFPEVQALLDVSPFENLFLIDKLEKTRLSPHSRARWLGVRDAHDRLSAVSYTPRSRLDNPADTAVPYGDPEACSILGARVADEGGTRMVVGPRAACDALWRGLGAPQPRRRHQQRLYVAENHSGLDSHGVGRARPEDVDALADMQAGMLAEDLGIHPAELERDILRRRVQDRVLSGATWVIREAERPVFTVNVGFRNGRGAQVGGTYVWPECRGRGLATTGMRGLVNVLMGDGVPRVTLHVNEENRSAVRCYESAGFQPVSPFRLMVF